MAWSPLAGGLLSGKASAAGASPEGARRDSLDFPPVDMARAHAVVEAMRPIAAAQQVSVAQVALAWLLAQKAVSTVIVGAKTPEQLADNLAASSLSLTPEEIQSLDSASALPTEYPGWMLALQGQFLNRQSEPEFFQHFSTRVGRSWSFRSAGYGLNLIHSLRTMRLKIDSLFTQTGTAFTQHVPAASG